MHRLWLRVLAPLALTLGISFIATLWPGPKHAHAKTIAFEQNELAIAGPMLEAYEDERGKLSFAGVQSAAFETLKRHVPNNGYTRSVWWYRVKLHNQTGGPVRRYLVILWPRLNRVDFHWSRGPREITSDDGFLHAKSGWTMPFSERTVPSRLHTAPLEFAPGEIKTVYVRVQSLSEMLVPVQLKTEAGFIRDVLFSNLINGGYLGALLALALYNLILGLRLRTRYHFLYVAQVTAFAGYIHFTGGMLGFHEVLTRTPQLVMDTTVSAWMFFHIAFARSFMETHLVLPYFDRLLRSLQWGVTPATFLLGFALDQQTIDQLTSPVFAFNVLSILAAGVLALHKGVQQARWFVYAYSSFALGFVLAILIFSGFLQWHPALGGALIIFGTLAELVVLSLALSERMRVAANEKLHAVRQAQERRLQALQDLVAGVTHELNSPVGALNSGVQSISKVATILSHDYDKDASASESSMSDARPAQGQVSEKRATQRYRQLDRARRSLTPLTSSMQQAIDRIGRTLGSLKQFARLDAPEEDAVDLNQGIKSALVLLEPRLGKDINIKTELSELPRVHCRAGQIHQVFMALLQNAVAAVDSHGQIHVSSTRDGDHVEIVIADTGRGISQERIAKLFNPALIREGDRVHMGLGLPTSLSLVQQHGGTLTLASKLNSGTTATVRLPIERTTPPSSFS